MSYGKKIKRAQKRGNTAKVERLTAKQAKRKSKRVTLYTPGKDNGSVTIGRQKFNKLTQLSEGGNLAKYAPGGRSMFDFTDTNRDAKGKRVKTLMKKLGISDFSGDNLAKAKRALTYANPTVVNQPAAAPAAAEEPAETATDNPYRDESSALLSTIDSLVQSMSAPPPPPQTIYAGSTNVSSPGNLQIAPAAGINKRGGTNNFKRRTKAAPTNTLRTIQSVNV